MRLGVCLTLFIFLTQIVCADSISDAPLIDVKKFDFSLTLDIRYATENNFTRKKVYPEAKCFLRKPVAEALSRVQASLKVRGLKLKIFDCYRPLSVQKRFWELVPDERYVSDPKKGSRHNRGAAVDVTLINAEGQDLEMPTAFDDFTVKAHRDYRLGTKRSRAHRDLLEKAMESEGFVGFPTEWWHFDFINWQNFPLEDISFSEIP